MQGLGSLTHNTQRQEPLELPSTHGRTGAEKQDRPEQGNPDASYYVEEPQDVR